MMGLQALWDFVSPLLPNRLGCSHRRRSGLRLPSPRQAMTAFQLALFALSIVAGLAVWILPRLIYAMFKESRE